MISSGIKRGLAGTAVAALAVTGLPFLASSASANSLVEQATADLGASGVDLVTTDSGVASFNNDGVESTVHLVAEGGSDVQQVTFQYQNPVSLAWVNIATVSRNAGVFSTEWAPPASIYNLPVSIRAVALGSVGTEISNDTNLATVSANADSVDIAYAPGASVGLFQQPYTTESEDALLGAVSGTTSDVSANPDLTFSSPSGTGATTTEDVAGTVANGATSRSYSAPVDFSGYNWAGDVDQALIYAEADGDDAEPVSVYQATITTVTAAAASSTVQGAETTSATVTVLDQNGNPIVGAQVVSEDTGGTVAYTNSQGKATFTGLTGSAAGSTYDFYVNTTDTDAYENGVDFRRSVTVTSYTATATTITPTSTDGAAFDDDEYTAGDVFVVVKDQNGAPLAGETVSYSWAIDPFDSSIANSTVTGTTAASGADGKATIPVPVGSPSGTYTLTTYINRDGTPGQQAGDLAGGSLTVKAGQADIVWDDDAVAQAPSGTTDTFEGSLELEDGTGLPSRNLAVTWSATGNAVVAAQAAQPSGTSRVSDTAATAVTGADGSFGVALADPAATPNVDELNGVLTASTTNTPGIGNAGASTPLEVDFLRSTAPADANDIVVSVDDLFGAVTPGRPVDLDITVFNADGVELTDYPVQISVNHGFLSPNAENIGELTPDPAPAEGGEFGEWASDGTSKSYDTDDDGDTGAVVAIERDEAFDTNEDVTTTVTIKAGNVTTTVPVTFTTDYTPVNPGDLSIELADEQSVTVLPKAPTTETVNYDVFATDQFGNLVPNRAVEVSDDLVDAYMDGDDDTTTVYSNLKDESPALQLNSDVTGDQTVSGEWAATTRTYTDSDTVTPGFQPTVVVNNVVVEDEAAPVNWYEIDFAAATYSITHTGGSVQPVGTTVTVTYKAVDQNGEPIEGLWVEFFRTGPDDLQDGDGNDDGYTNENGEVSYVYQGAKAGTAVVTAVLYDAPNGTIIPQGEQTDTVQFGKAPINLAAGGKNNGAKADKLKVTADDNAAGLVAKVFVNGKKVAAHKLNNTGDWNFTIKDKNGNKATKYVVKVAASETTQADQASKKLK